MRGIRLYKKRVHAFHATICLRHKRQKTRQRRFSKTRSKLLVICNKMHRAYQPITPANNMLLKKRWDISRYNAHRQKVGERRTQLNGSTKKNSNSSSKICIIRTENMSKNRINADKQTLLMETSDCKVLN